MSARTRVRMPLRVTCTCLAAAATGSCVEAATWPDFEQPTAPEQRADGWPVASPQELGFDPQRLALMHELLQAHRTGGVDALLVARAGTLVYEGYFSSGAAVENTHMLASGTKSVVSLLVGAAVGRGLIQGSEQPISELFPEHADIFAAQPEKRGITLRDVLTMSAGLQWGEHHPSDPDNDSRRMARAPDAARWVLEQPLVSEPGSEFVYSGGCSTLLAAAVRNVTGTRADTFAEEALFGPLGIESYVWGHFDDGLVDGEGGLHLRGRDFLKLGQLALHNGSWNGQQVIPTSWIQESIRPWIGTGQYATRYGYQWWTYDLPRSDGTVEPAGIVLASGYGGQKLFLVPTLDLAVVTFGCTSEDGLRLSGYECGYAHNAGELVLYNHILRSLDAW
jgi:CubicO group peptidase (beta-lactamase class C family)